MSEVSFIKTFEDVINYANDRGVTLLSVEVSVKHREELNAVQKSEIPIKIKQAPIAVGIMYKEKEHRLTGDNNKLSAS